MTLEIVQNTLLWCAVINMGMLVWWFLFIVFAHDWVYRMHSKWFKISEERFDAIHYTGIAFFKLCVFFFNIVPYIALRIAS